jgi:hypothetical protein
LNTKPRDSPNESYDSPPDGIPSAFNRGSPIGPSFEELSRLHTPTVRRVPKRLSDERESPLRARATYTWTPQRTRAVCPAAAPLADADAGESCLGDARFSTANLSPRPSENSPAPKPNWADGRFVTVILLRLAHRPRSRARSPSTGGGGRARGAPLAHTPSWASCSG